VMPHDDSDDLSVGAHGGDDSGISSGAIGVLRIDGKGRGFAAGIGLAFSRRHLEGELMFLRSELSGGYIGLRYRLLTGWVRPYLGAGVPAFVFDQPDATGTMTTTKLAIGLRGAAGVELRINGHLSVQGDVGYEHFFVDDDSGFEANELVPTLGVIGRL